MRASAGPDVHDQLAERRLRAAETAALGGAHAADHAHQRAAGRRIGGGEAQRGDNALVPLSIGGEWAPPMPFPGLAIHAVLMHTGKLLVFGYPRRPGVYNPDSGQTTGPHPGYSEAFVFDPATGQSKPVPPPSDIFCAGATPLPNGRILVVGGLVGDPLDPDYEGLDTIYTFDPVTETWTLQGRTRQGRWYPTQLEMADGRTVIIAGRPDKNDPDWPDRVNTDVEIFSADGALQRLESLQVDKEDDEPTVPGHAPMPGQYPHMFWMPGGHALVAGPRMTDTWRLHPPTPGADDASWEDVADLPTFRQWAAGALLPGSSRVMLFGGSANRDDHAETPPPTSPATTSTTIFDDVAPGRGWTEGPAMNVSRSFANSVLLPDGTVAIVGGGVGEDTGQTHYRWLYTEAHKQVEIYDPVANTFTLGNAQAEARTYHSTALLLPDGRVLSAGDDINGPGGPGTGTEDDTVEIWSPPYLFRGPRPGLDWAPEVIQYGRPFTAVTKSQVERAVLVAAGASTHNTNMSQRVVELGEPRPASGDDVNIAAPASADLAPPGYYMLFLLDAAGVPSVARFVRLEPAPLALKVRAHRPRLARLRRTGRLPLRVGLNAEGTVRLALRRAGRELAQRTLTFARPGTRTLRLRLNRRRVARGRVVRMRLKAVGRVPGRGVVRRALRVTVRR